MPQGRANRRDVYFSTPKSNANLHVTTQNYLSVWLRMREYERQRRHESVSSPIFCTGGVWTYCDKWAWQTRPEKKTRKLTYFVIPSSLPSYDADDGRNGGTATALMIRANGRASRARYCARAVVVFIDGHGTACCFRRRRGDRGFQCETTSCMPVLYS